MFDCEGFGLMLFFFLIHFYLSSFQMFFYFVLSFCAGMIVCFFLVFGCTFYLFFFLFWVLSWLLCSITSVHILSHEYYQQSSCVSGWVHDKQLVSLCYEWLRPSDTLRGLSNHYIVIKTLRRASVLSSDRRGFMVSICVEISSMCLGSWKDVPFVA